MSKPSPLIPLLLRRMHLTGATSRHEAVAIQTSDDQWDSQEQRKATKRHAPGVKVLRSLGLLTDSWSCKTGFWLPEGFEVPTIADVLAHLDTGRGPAITELTAYILLKGKCQHYYGHSRWESELVHTLLCGVDWAKSSSPENDSWDEFAGTFAESDKESMTQVRLECLCGFTDRYSNKCVVGVGEMSVIELLAASSAGMRDQL